MSLTVAFVDHSTPGPSGPITAWEWDFGDENTSTSENPSHTYAAYGSYTVTLTVTGTGGDGTASASIVVTLTNPGALAADFHVSASDLVVTFKDASSPGPSGPITAWSWDFGDGATSTTENPSHTYAAAGTYTVTLTITGTGTDGTATKSETVTVSSGGSPTPVPVGALIFSDEFDGAADSTPDTSKWGAKSGKAGNGDAYWDGFTRATMDGAGNLQITATLVSGVWRSAFISSKTPISGARYVEARAKMAPGDGCWSAPVWEWAYPFGANNLENDVNEQLGDSATQYHATLHNWNTKAQSGKVISCGVDLSAAFHLYGAAVYSDHVDFYFDGVKKATILASAIGFSDLSTLKVVENIDLNMGGWGGAIGVSGPVTLLVDYIRVYALA